jgi:hypothetical protein
MIKRIIGVKEFFWKGVLIIILSIVFLPFVSFSQKYGNVWYFGEYAGIDFNNCQPVALTDGNNIGFEGCATVCDTNGQMLFYTNSETIWDRTHNMMLNGYLIVGGGTLSQVIILPQPLSNSIYYIFTTPIQANAGYLEYHVVDMSLNSGLGQVISKNNILINSHLTTEQVAATYHANGTDIWVITHEYGNNHFLCYLFNSTGLDTIPIVSSVGVAQVTGNSNFNARGEIKFSPDGSMVAFNGNGIAYNDSADVLELLNFNNLTGILSNPIDLPYSRGEFGLSFSPDNSKLYGTTWKAFGFIPSDTNFLYQFDLSSHDSLTIVNSKQIISTSTESLPFGSLEIGPDGKIYVAQGDTGYLGVINKPNLPGSLCNYIHNGFYLQGKTCKLGLNNYIEYINYCDSTTSVEEQNNFDLNLQLFPNPTTASIHLAINTKQNTPLRCEIINVLGEKVFQTEIKNTDPDMHRDDVSLNVSFLAKGIYLVKVGDGKSFENKKLGIE